MIKWIDALEFEDFGGFSKETQFVREMGQGYLLACGVPGAVVDPASTSFEVEESGMHRIWLRVKNWLRPASPGRLALIVDGTYVKREMCALPITDWHFEVAGDIYLEKGTHSLVVEDMSGYFGRFSAVVITDDVDFMPEQPVDRMLKQRAIVRGENTEPEFVGDFDIIVAGGGPAGAPCAIAAARKGLRVALVQSRPGIGGNGSEEGIVGFDGASSNFPFVREGGIAEELRRIKETKETTWEKSLKEIASHEKTLTIFQNKFVIDATSANGKIEKIKAVDTETGKYYEYSAKYYIDCTGDGWLGYYAGAAYRLGREAKWQYDEPFAPEAPDNYTMSGCIAGYVDSKRNALGFLTEDTGETTPYTAPDWAVKLPENIYRIPSGLRGSQWWVENPNDLDDLWHEEETRDELMRLNLGYFHWVKNHYTRRDLAKNLKLVGLAKYNAKRESRRLMGDYVFTQNDCIEGKVFEDAISYCGWMIDIHHTRGIYSGAEGPFNAAMKIPLTTIPYRSLYSKNISNLLMGGRCISVSHLGLGSVRVQNTLATVGQAAGTAAALCVEKGVTPRELYQNHLKYLQQTLIKDDLHIPGFKSEDEADKARLATATSDSVSSIELFDERKGVEAELVELKNKVLLVMPYTGRKPDKCSVYLKNESGEDREITATATVSKSKREFESKIDFDKITQTVPAGFDGYMNFPFAYDMDFESIEPDYDGESAGLTVGVILDECEGVCVKKFLMSTFEKMSATPINSIRWQSDIYNSYCFELFEDNLPQANCEPSNVINGYNRMVSPENYEFVSDPKQDLPQSITLTWDNEQDINEIRIAFDSDLSNPSMAVQKMKYVRRMVKDYYIEALQNGEWVKIAERNDNIFRQNIIKLDETVKCKAIKLTATSTYGDKSLRIFEIRAY